MHTYNTHTHTHVCTDTPPPPHTHTHMHTLTHTHTFTPIHSTLKGAHLTGRRCRRRGSGVCKKAGEWRNRGLTSPSLLPEQLRELLNTKDVGHQVSRNLAGGRHPTPPCHLPPHSSPPWLMVAWNPFFVSGRLSDVLIRRFSITDSYWWPLLIVINGLYMADTNIC